MLMFAFDAEFGVGYADPEESRDLGKYCAFLMKFGDSVVQTSPSSNSLVLREN
jgi:hypothetical protein